LIVDRTSIAACLSDARKMYAVSDDDSTSPRGQIAAVWKSIDGGQAWAMILRIRGRGSAGRYWRTR
jgi:hypothetical protein